MDDYMDVLPGSAPTSRFIKRWALLHDEFDWTECHFVSFMYVRSCFNNECWGGDRIYTISWNNRAFLWIWLDIFVVYRVNNTVFKKVCTNIVTLFKKCQTIVHLQLKNQCRLHCKEHTLSVFNCISCFTLCAHVLVLKTTMLRC